MSTLDLAEFNRGFDYLADTIWLACAIDGEGSIIMVGVGNPRSGTQKYTSYVSVTNTNCDFIEKAASIMGTKITPHQSTFPNSKECFVTITGKQSKIKVILERVLPFLIIKEEHAKLVLEWVEIRRYCRSGCGILGGTRLKRETEIYNRLRELNKKGRNY
jgi:hypothetical protein